jgi:hypothetical protein
MLREETGHVVVLAAADIPVLEHSKDVVTAVVAERRERTARSRHSAARPGRGLAFACFAATMPG